VSQVRIDFLFDLEHLKVSRHSIVVTLSSTFKLWNHHKT